MKLSGRGIGWLIFGIIVCMSATESEGMPAVIGTIAMGLVFIAVYFIKQRFDPDGTGWFIAGGIFLAFSFEQLLSIMTGFISRFSILPGELSDMLTGFIVAVICLYVFYRKNKDNLEEAADDLGNGTFTFPGEEEDSTEETIEIEVSDGQD